MTRVENGSKMKRAFMLETTQWRKQLNENKQLDQKLALSFVFVIYYRFIISDPLEFVSAHAMNNLRKHIWKSYV